MKIILSILLFISSICSAQNIDTITVRNLTFQGQDWAWLIGDAPIYNDSVSISNFRRIRNVVQATSNIQWTTNVTVDSLAGSTVMYFYQKVKTADAGEIAARYTAITSSIESKINLTSFINNVNETMQNNYLNKRNKGKYILIDY